MWDAEENVGWKFGNSVARSGIVVEDFGTLRWLSGIMGAGFGTLRCFGIKWWEFGVLRSWNRTIAGVEERAFSLTREELPISGKRGVGELGRGE